MEPIPRFALSMYSRSLMREDSEAPRSCLSFAISALSRCASVVSLLDRAFSCLRLVEREAERDCSAVNLEKQRSRSLLVVADRDCSSESFLVRFLIVVWQVRCISLMAF